jgi:hypothetical protein
MTKGLQVVATAVGHYGKHRRPGQSFEIQSRDHFTPNWMRPVGWDPNDPEPAPEPKTDPVAVLRDRVAELEREVSNNNAAFDAIRASLVKVPGLPADLKLAQAVAWMADRLADNITSPAMSEGTSKSKTSTKKE